MFQYLIRRILLALPTLLVISFLAFGLGKCAPGDPVINVFGEEAYTSLDPAQQAKIYRANAERLGLTGAGFYCSLTTAAYPDTIWRIFPLDRRARLEKLIGQTGNWPAVKDYDSAISELARAIESLPSNVTQSARLRSEFTLLLRSDQLSLLDSAQHRIHLVAAEMQDSTRLSSTGTSPEFSQPNPALSSLVTTLSHLDVTIQALKTQHFPDRLRTPRLYWHGLNNQYHHWLSGFLTGDLGLTRRKLDVWKELQSGLIASLVINGLAIFLAYLIAIPLGVEMARRKNKWQDRWIKRSLFFLYSMPVFWMAGLLMIVFTNTAWGHAILPSIYFDIQDAWQPGKTSFSVWWSANAPKCVLPILILTLHTLAILALQMRGSLLSALGEDYIRTARAKGVSEEDIYWNHGFRNALFPIITIFSSVLPAAFSGSLIIETLFNFPGIGTKTLEAYLGKDLPLLSAILMVTAVLTVLGSLLADLLYAIADPRVRFAKENG